ncbi:MAG: hypothetical protein HYT88_00910 [Candidatus Omnitrophica bacterium]|nr:hypothetical protein [Candidatus Omnitrophota bacterium]MBI3010181.1 hypothetical protein [Candidatus Omnitrophota bacterium]
MKPGRLALAVFSAASFLIVPVAEANPIRGLFKMVAGVLQVPLSTLVGTVSGPPIVGTVLGAVNGTVSGVGLVLGGAWEVAAFGVDAAKAAAPFVLPFLF